jgi:hypothetical protein
VSEKARPLLLESVIVIVSILIAFALDASWARLQARNDLSQDLAGVADELRSNRRALTYQILLVERVAGSLEGLLGTMDARPTAGWISVPDTTVWISQRTPTFNPSFGAIEALIAAGRLAAVEDPTLRRALAGLRDRATDAGEELLEAQTVYLLVETPVLFPGLELRSLREVAARLPDSWGTRGIEGGDQIEFPNSRVLRSAMEQRRGLYQLALAELRGLERHLTEIEARLDVR